MTSDSPYNAQQIFETACQEIQNGHIGKAIEILEGLTERTNEAEYISKLGTAYAILGNRSLAIKKFEKAIAANENFAIAYANLALALAEEGRHGEALPIAEKGLSIDPNNIHLYSTYALILKHIDRIDDAIAALLAALKENGENVQILANLGGLMAENGMAEEAQQTLEKVVALAPGYGSAHRMLSLTKTYQKGDPHIRRMESILKQADVPPDIQIELNFALAKAYEDIKNYHKSFGYYKNANDKLRNSYQYSIEEQKEFFEDIKSKFTKEFIENNKANPSDIRPIFILGMPRSGTSLVEQILASHSEVYAAGELNSIGRFQDLQSNDFQYKQQQYLGALKDRHIEKEIITDKMPQNFQFIGFIKTIFPNAKIIHCKRNRMDTLFSIYKTKFSGYVPFAQNLTELSQFYQMYEDMMAYWHEVMPEEIFDLSYEELVEAPEENIRAMLTFCEMEWDEGCLSFHENKRSVTTASALQVRKPIYKSAIQYWKNYEPYLANLLKPDL